jgi:hypothetical protein
MHGKGFEMTHELYVQVLSAMFLFWNGARILTYIPTIGKLLAREADVRSYSLLSWGSWALSNGTFALMLLEMSRGIPNQMFWLNVANTLMCLVVSFIILAKRFPRRHALANMLNRRIRRNDLKRVGMSKQAKPADAGAGSPGVDGHLEVDAMPSARPARFGRLALWSASTSALVVGIVGIVADGDRFNHDQGAYVDATASPRQAFGIIEPTSPAQQTSSSGQAALSVASCSREHDWKR